MEIPSFPDSRPLGLDDKPLLDREFARLQPVISEFTFANLYLFRIPHLYRLSMVGDAIVILGRGYDGREYFLPPLCGDISTSILTLLKRGMTLYGVDSSFIENHFRNQELEIIPDRDNFDYLYLREELAELPGNRFHKKKNRINYFAARHDYRVELYDDRHLQGALSLLHDWYRVRGSIESLSSADEVAANSEALKMAVPLGLAGLVVIVGDEVKGFALGERLNADTSVCHFEKADPFLEGVSQLVEREFNRLLFTDCVYVNREQDLGEPGLRNAKLSYHPMRFVEKFRVGKRSMN